MMVLGSSSWYQSTRVASQASSEVCKAFPFSGKNPGRETNELETFFSFWSYQKHICSEFFNPDLVSPDSSTEHDLYVWIDVEDAFSQIFLGETW